VGVRGPRPQGKLIRVTTFAERIDAITLDSLRKRGSVKWTVPGPEGYGAFVAEMDFGAAPAILDALAGLSADANFGYLSEPLTQELGAACAAWQRDRYGWDVPDDSVHPLPDVIKGLEVAMTHFSRGGAPVILPTPAYMPFLLVPKFLGREIIQVPMHNEDGFFTLDLDGIDAAYRQGGDLIIFCNPYNPLGRVFDRTEMTALTGVVDRHGGRVFADEIHAPLVYAGGTHVPYASTSETAAGHTITATSASKGWNLPGLKCAEIILTNDADRAVWDDIGMWSSHGASNPGVVANIAAFRNGGDWLADVLDYLDGNRKLLAELVDKQLPEVRYRPPDGTYLAWLDFRDLDLPQSPGEFMTERAKVVVVDGPAFGDGGPGSLRFNFATPRHILTEMVERMAAAVHDPSLRIAG
jgi:cysteine-S-conjugate beta-lyase